MGTEKNRTMVLNYIWIAFFVVGFAFGIVGLCTGDTTLFQKMVDATLRLVENGASRLPSD